ncbi:hypothetical protein JKP88DRAFT_272182 [Tribonema minus]|uniref:Uncharacterized protein n=1 Tax=Tribonema minus TaxID=303371 RepID=A0A836CNF2_9STRA|nr:hypothetical protein JKP88DRAFT_272182 [Tribonema minus]
MALKRSTAEEMLPAPDECGNLRALCGGGLPDVPALCAMLASPEGWGDDGLGLLRRHAVASVLSAFLRESDAKMIYLIRAYRAVPPGCRGPLHVWVFAHRGHWLQGALNDAALKVDDDRNSTWGIWYRHHDAVHEDVDAAVRSLLPYHRPQQLDGDCAAVHYNNAARKRPASRHELRPEPSLHAVAGEYSGLLDDMESVIGVMEGLVRTDLTSSTPTRIARDLKGLRADIAGKREALEPHLGVPALAAMARAAMPPWQHAHSGSWW